jgi:hypothetical protein
LRFLDSLVNIIGRVVYGEKAKYLNYLNKKTKKLLGRDKEVGLLLESWKVWFKSTLV